MTGEALAIVEDSLRQNAMMAHPESILLGMLSDERREVRERAVQLIREARERRTVGPVRPFKCPVINSDA